MNYEMALVNAVLDTEIENIPDILEQNVQNVFFEYSDIWQYVQEFYFNYKTLPTKDVIKNHFSEFEFMGTEKLPYQYYIDEAKKLAMTEQIRRELHNCVKLLNDSGPNAALSHITARGLSLMRDAGTLKDTNLITDYKDRVESFRERSESDSHIAGIPTGISVIDNIFGGWQGGDFIVVLGWTASGKAMVNGTPVLTDIGWKKIEDITIDDKVYGNSGKPINVIGVWPQGIRPIYRLHLSDGNTIDCDEEHLWTITVRGREKTLSTKDIFKTYNGRESRYQPVLPKLEPIQFPVQRTNVDPYTMGVLLGDGCFIDPSITCSPEDWNAIAPKLIGRFSDRKAPLAHGWLGGKTVLMKMRLNNLKSKDKFIPEEYLYNSVENRIELLRGLMDADGTASGGTNEFSSSSLLLAEGVQSLVRSLGGKAKIVKRKTKRLDNYRVYITIDICPFYLPRKVKVWKKFRSVRKVTDRLRIRHVEYIGQDSATCISVDAENGLFVVKDYIVTHNSWITRGFAVDAWKAGYSPLIISLEMNKEQEGYRFDTILNQGTTFKNSDLMFGRGMLPETYSEWADKTFHDKHPFHLVTSEGIESANQNMVEAKIEQYKPDLVILDYHSLFQDAGGSTGETEKAKNLSQAFKTLAVKYNVPIVDIAAVTMQDGHGERPPELNEVAWTKQLAFDADLVLAVNRRKDEDVFEVASRKVRRGQDFAFRLKWDLDTGKRRELFDV